MDLERLSLNIATTEPYSLQQAVVACEKMEIPWIGPWRHKVAKTGLRESAQIIRSHGLKVSSLCRGGMFAAPTQTERLVRLDDNRRAIEEAAALSTDVLVLVCGPPNGCALDDARKMVEEGIATLIPFASEHGVKLGIEPLHPVFAADRSVIVTLGQANDIVNRLQSPQVGVVIDVYHVWWDPLLYTEIRRAEGHILGFHVNDWILPLRDSLTSRGMMGEGFIEISRIRTSVESSGYQGPIEVEIMNEELWSRSCQDIVQLSKQNFLQYV